MAALKSMDAPFQLDKLIAESHAHNSCSLEQTLLRYPGIKQFFSPLISLAAWLMELFNPPPLDSMNLPQKAGRVLLFAATLVIASIFFAMVGALGLYVMERGRAIGSAPEFYQGFWILLLGIGVNIGCVFVLLQIKKADTKLMPPPDKQG
jgi:hypothetical protein